MVVNKFMVVDKFMGVNYTYMVVDKLIVVNCYCMFVNDSTVFLFIKLNAVILFGVKLNISLNLVFYTHGNFVVGNYLKVFNDINNCSSKSSPMETVGETLFSSESLFFQFKNVYFSSEKIYNLPGFPFRRVFYCI